MSRDIHDGLLALSLGDMMHHIGQNRQLVVAIEAGELSEKRPCAASSAG